MSYTAPVSDIRFTLETICKLDDLAERPAFSDLSSDLVDAILEEAGKLASGALAPLNWPGDQAGSVRQSDGSVKTPEGFPEAYKQFVEGGWNCLSGSTEYGGQGLPYIMQTAVMDMMTSANMAFSLCPLLSQGAIEALTAHGTEDLRQTYLEKLISGEWTGTMNLTEPQAGSDVGALRTKAVPQDNGTYLISGQKIFITWGEHDCAENIVHLVLARLPGAPEGTRGISLFLVPKYLVNDDGSLGERNDLRCVSVEHKLGIHASPTCTMSYGDEGKCVGYLIGEENRGMACMFTMMNNARIGVGLQGVAISERAYQHALHFARERVQSPVFGSSDRSAKRIIDHADVRRMLLKMKSLAEACRAIVYRTAVAVDRAHQGHDDERAREKGIAELLTPIAKALSTDVGVEVSSLGIQVFGGMGYVEETGAAQHFRDSRIAPIYEGTNGIQAIDLVGRKLNMAGGAVWKDWVQEMRQFCAQLPGDGELGAIKPYLEDAIEATQTAAVWMQGNADDGLNDTAAGATPFLRMFGLTTGGYLLTKQAQHAASLLEDRPSNKSFLEAKITTARFFAEQILPHATAALGPVTRGAELLYALDESQFAA
ncbi:MAG: acyl-CoA dehydrogenase C-terminal domain-containing protein [Pseudomonadota bacterium]